MSPSNQETQKTFPLWMKLVLLTIMIVFFAGGGWFFLAQQKLQQRLMEKNLWSIANLKVEQISKWRAEKIADASILMERRALVESIRRYLSGTADQEAPEIMRRLRPVKELYHFADILVLDPQKRVRLSLAQNTGAAFDGFLPALEEAIAARRPIWTPIHIGSEFSSPHLGVMVPLFSVEAGGSPVGALVLINDAAQFLYPIIQEWPTPSDTVETLLVQKDGEDVLFLNELRHQTGTALTLRIPISRVDLPAAMAVTGVRGIVEGRDYRGVKVIAAILPIPDSPWFMVSKVDAVEAFAEWRFRSIMILMFLFCGVGLVVVIWFLVGQRNLKAHYRKLYRSEADLSQALKRHGITLRAIGDGVISTDSEGRVTLMNPVAESLTGWSQETARGEKLSDVFQIIDEKSRRPVENTVVRVVREGRIVGLADNILLIARDGREIPIADSASPIRNERGEFIGVVLVFKDQTGERQYQRRIVESEQKYRFLADTTLDVIWTMNMDLEFTYVNPAIRQLTGFEPDEWMGSRLPDHCGEESFETMTEVFNREVARGADHQGVVFETEMLKKDGALIFLEIHALVLFDENGTPSGLQGTARDITERLEREKVFGQMQEQLAEARKMESIGRLAGGMAHDYNNMLNIIIGYSELGMAMMTPEEPLYANFKEIITAAQRSAGITGKLLAFARRQFIAVKVVNLNAILEGRLDTMKQLIGKNIDLAWRPGSNLWPVKVDPSQLDQVLSNLCANARDAIDGPGRVIVETKNVSLDEAHCADHPGSVPGDFVMLAVSDDGRGMDPETLANIFEPFFTTKPFGESAGLGLAMVYGIAKQNNGFVDVESNPGKGTTFRLYLPRPMAPRGSESDTSGG